MVAVQPWRHKHDIERIYCITHCCQPASRLQNNSSRTHYARWLLKVRANDCAHGDSNLISTSSPPHPLRPQLSVFCVRKREEKGDRLLYTTERVLPFTINNGERPFYIYIFNVWLLSISNQENLLPWSCAKLSQHKYKFSNWRQEMSENSQIKSDRVSVYGYKLRPS